MTEPVAEMVDICGPNEQFGGMHAIIGLDPDSRRNETSTTLNSAKTDRPGQRSDGWAALGAACALVLEAMARGAKSRLVARWLAPVGHAGASPLRAGRP